jgi:hypothetical protein
MSCGVCGPRGARGDEALPTESGEGSARKQGPAAAVENTLMPAAFAPGLCVPVWSGLSRRHRGPDDNHGILTAY